jgi:hypothetical protein
MALKGSALSSVNNCKRIDVALLSQTHIKPQERYFTRNYRVYQTDCQPGFKGGTAIAVKKVSHILM